MKKLKQALSLTLALVLSLALTVPAFADGWAESTGGEIWEDVFLTLEDVTFNVDPIGVVTIQYMKEDGSQDSVVTAYMFNQPASVSIKDGRVFTDRWGYEWVSTPYGEGLDGGQEMSGVLSIDNNTFGLKSFYFAEEPTATYYKSPYMVSKSYVDSLIAEGRHKVDIQPYTAAQPAEPAAPEQTETPAEPEKPAEPEQPAVPTVTIPEGSVAYTVQKGDTMGFIATNFYGNNAQREALYQANIEAFRATKGALKPGMVLAIPAVLNKAVRIAAPVAGAGEKLYTVKAGDTLGQIAAAEYGNANAYKAIFERNSDRLTNANTIYEGQVIVLPAKK